jgi:hypothetical protein
MTVTKPKVEDSFYCGAVEILEMGNGIPIRLGDVI